MGLLRRSFDEFFVLKLFLVSCFVCGTYCTNDGNQAADDSFRQRTPMELLRASVQFLSSKSQADERLKQAMREIQAEVFQTSYLQLCKDVLDSGVLEDLSEGRSLREDSEKMAAPPSQEFYQNPVDVDDYAADDNTTTTTAPAYNLTTTDDNNSTTGTYTTTNVTTDASTPVTTTSLSNVTTAPEPIPTPNPTCVNHTTQMLMAAIEKQPWALQMVDADGKPGPNLKALQFFWVGDYEECTTARDNISETEILFKGRYCTAVFPFQPFDTRPLMPALPPTGIRVGLCVPDSCSGTDVTLMINKVLVSLNSSYRVGLTTCQAETVDYDAKAIVSLFICSVFLLLMSVGTVFDLLAVQWPAWREKTRREAEGDSTAVVGDGYSMIGNPVTERPAAVVENGEREPLLGAKKARMDSEGLKIGTMGRVLLAFSVYTNGKKILHASHSPGSITCIHGIRFISMTWVILGHTFVFSLTTAENYLTYMTENLGHWTFQAIIGAPASVDTFFSLSGLLVAYLILKEMEKRNGKVQWFLFYFHRFWRLTPPYAFVMMMLITLFRYFGKGPIWPQGGTEINYCEDTWWTNLLYINNFVRVKEMCISWSWYLANDMQFYVVSPLLFVPLFFWRRVGVALAFLWLLATLLTAGLISRLNDFPPSVSLASKTNPMESADYFYDFYIKPYCRFGPYVVGMLTGYALFVTKGQVKMPLAVSLSGWAVATASALAVVYGLYGEANHDPLTADESALYNSASHTVWGVCVCWVIFACATGHGGPVNTFLSWNAFIPVSRLTYTAYLVHPIVMNLYHLGAPSAFYMSNFHCTILFLGFTVAAFGAAFLLSLAFEAPMMALEKVLLPKPAAKH
ncbi:nose resistant to fluoxetine protein 6-like [Babylonia areolata]|uniref:nose resistant to fluoxetine protein 6-like n=1 Tax=Babylonia areolata TaxID=304850 RepID=UPI003FD1DF3E